MNIATAMDRSQELGSYVRMSKGCLFEIDNNDLLSISRLCLNQVGIL